MKTIFITGASSGIGKETAKYFANKGWRVIATMRNPDKAGELAAMENVIVMPLDLTDSQQISDTCSKALEQYDVDVLFNNAGYAVIAPLEEIPEEKIRQQFDTNVIGMILVTQQFIPHFKKRKAGTILTTTSFAGIAALPRDCVYGAVKRAQHGVIESLYYEMKPFGVSVKALIPNGTRTNFKVELNVLTGYENVAKNQLAFLLDGDEAFPGPEEAAETAWIAVNDGKDQIDYPADHICKRIYAKWDSMNKEEFKNYFCGNIFPEQK